MAHILLHLIAIINIILAVINLLPIPPLDGSKIWPCLIPGMKPAGAGKMMWVFVAILLVLVWSGGIAPLTTFVIHKFEAFMPQSDAKIFQNHYDNATIAYDQKDYQLAEKEFSEAISIKSHDGDCYYWRACAKGGQDNWAGALDDMNMAVEFGSGEPRYYEYRAKIYEYFDRHEEAEKDRLMAKYLKNDQSPTAKPD